MLEWLTLSNEDCNKIGAIADIVTSSGVIIVIFSWVKSLRNFIESIFNFFKSLLVKIKSSMHSWLQEKIVGKENLELLEKLEILKGNKRAIEFLERLKGEDECSKVNGWYEALNAILDQYSTEMDFSEFKNAYEKDVDDRKKRGNGLNVINLRKDTFEKLIKKYSENNKEMGEKK